MIVGFFFVGFEFGYFYYFCFGNFDVFLFRDYGEVYGVELRRLSIVGDGIKKILLVIIGKVGNVFNW